MNETVRRCDSRPCLPYYFWLIQVNHRKVQLIQLMIPEERGDYDYDSSDEEEIPEYINEENRRLNIMAKKQKKDLKNIIKESDQLEERHKIIQEHAKNVEQQRVHLQGLIQTKQKEIESENHMKQVTERQNGRLQSEMKKLEKQEVDFRERLNDSQVRMHQVQEKCEQLKLELNWNQQELEQWVMVTKQKQQDHVDLQRFKKQDEIKIRELSLQIEKLTVQVARKQKQLEKEITETQTVQIELDKSAQEFKKLHNERHKLFEKWQEVTRGISKRNDDIQNKAIETANLKAQIAQQEELLEVEKTKLIGAIRENKESEAKVSFLMREIGEKKNQNKKIELETNSNLQAEVEILKNKLSSDSTELSLKRKKIENLQDDLAVKRERLNTQKQKYEAHQIKLKNQLKLAEKFTISKNEAEARLKQTQIEKKAVESKISIQKDVLVKSTSELFKLKDNQVALFGEIQGNVAACKNLQSHINKLNQQFQRQQELLYNAEYQIQLMERKVARAKGERTLEEKKDLQKEIDEVTKKNTQIKAQHKILNQSVKKLDEDLRGVENALTSVKQSEKHLTSVIEELTLENEMTAQDLNKVSKKKEEVLVQHDIMKLEIKKIKQTLGRASDNVFSLENRKNQLQMSMQQREKEIQVHKDILLAEFKAAEDQRHKIAIELAERTNKVKNLRVKYEALVQKSHGGSNQSVAEHSQAYYVIKAAQEREQLQRKGDQLSAKIIKAEKELKSLQCTLVDMKATNIKIKQKGLRRGLAKEDLDQKTSLEQQLNSASDALHNMRHEVNQNQRQYQEDMRRHTEVRNRIENLEGRRRGLDQQMRESKRQLEETLELQSKAKRSLNTIKNDPRNKTQVNPGSAQIAQLQFDVQKEKNKALFGSLMALSNEIPELAAALEEALKAREIELPNQPPSSIDMMSSKAMSVNSEQSQQSRHSQLSQNSQQSQQSRQSQNSKQSNLSGQSGMQRSNVSGMSGLSGSAIGRVTGISRNPR